MPTQSARHSEDLRQIEHLAPIGFAFLLRYLTWFQALSMALAAVLYSFVSSRIFTVTQRSEEAGKAVAPGKFLYAASVFFLILLLPGQYFIVAAVWANLSVGDSISNLAGRRFGRTVLPWNPKKTWVGMVAAFVFSTIAAFILLLWTGFPVTPVNPGMTALTLAIAASLVCSIAETLPLPIDDNVTICLVGALCLVFLTGAKLPPSAASTPVLVGLGLASAWAVPAFLLRKVSLGGAISGVFIAGTTYSAFGLAGFVLLATLLIIGAWIPGICSRKISDGARQARKSVKYKGTSVWGIGCAAFACAVASVFLEDKAAVRVAYVASTAVGLGISVGAARGGQQNVFPPLLKILRDTHVAGPTESYCRWNVPGLVAAFAVGSLGFFLGLTSVWGMLWSWISVAGSVALEGYLQSRRRNEPESGPLTDFLHTVVAASLSLVLSGTGR